MHQSCQSVTWGESISQLPPIKMVRADWYYFSVPLLFPPSLHLHFPGEGNVLSQNWHRYICWTVPSRKLFFLLVTLDRKQSWALWEVISLSLPTMSDSQSWARTLFLAAHQTKSGKLSKKVSLFHKQSKSFALPSSAQALLFLPFTLRSSELGLKSEIQILLPLHLRCLFCLAKKRLFE